MKTVLTTGDIAEPKRAQFWQDAVCDTFVELDCQAGVAKTFFGEITTAECEGLALLDRASRRTDCQAHAEAHPPRP